MLGVGVFDRQLDDVRLDDTSESIQGKRTGPDNCKCDWSLHASGLVTAFSPIAETKRKVL